MQVTAGRPDAVLEILNEMFDVILAVEEAQL